MGKFEKGNVSKSLSFLSEGVESLNVLQNFRFEKDCVRRFILGGFIIGISHRFF
jgi:hypothetical protein